MTVVSIKELSELAAKDETLKQMMIQMPKEHLAPEEIHARLREYGYEIKVDDPVSDIEELSDEDLEEVSGGTASDTIWNTACRFMAYLFEGLDESLCD